MPRIAELSRYLIPVLWLAWLAVWLVGWRRVKETRWQEPPRAALANRLPVLAGAAMLASPGWLPPMLAQRAITGPAPATLGTVLVGGGLALAVWARRHLGRNWSAAVEVKHDHTLVRSGPYRLVRHPIYSGMILALFGSALALGEWRGFVGAALIVFGFVLKLQAEEARMRDTFPEYGDYCRRTARLIPGVF